LRRRSIAELSAEVAANPDSTATIELAAAYRERGDLDRALRLCLRGLERHPALVAGHYELGCIHLARGDRQAARDEWAAVKALAPDHVETRLALARLYAEEGRRDDAVRELEDALRQRPGEPALLAALEELGGRPTDAEATGLLGATAAAPGPATPRQGGTARQASAGRAAAAAPGAERTAGARAAAPAVPEGFEGLAGPEEGWLGALLANGAGRVVLGRVNAGAGEVGEALAAQMAGAPAEARNVAAYLGLGEWRGLVVESEGVRLTVEEVGGHLLLVATRPAMPPGRTRQVHEAARRRADAWVREGGDRGIGV
jgi:tetratricopeptide (TPR) repeat protein